jgi:hypothetical protein
MANTDLASIRFVTARYRELQGLRTVLDGISLLAVWTILRWAPPDRRPGTFFLVALLWATFSMWGGARARRYYADHCGRAMRDVHDGYDRSVWALLHAPYQLLVASTAISLGGGFTLLLPILTATTAWQVWRDRPYRMHWLIPVAVGAAFTLAFFDVRNLAQAREWHWRLMVAGSLSLMIAGALDHRLLIKNMIGAGAASRAEHADPI